MITVPDWIDEARFDTTVERPGAKNRPVRLDDLRLEALSQGCCVQTLHVGAVDHKARTLKRRHHQFIPGNGMGMGGKHHEIYLSEFRNTPEKQRTMIRQPVTTDVASARQTTPTCRRIAASASPALPGPGSAQTLVDGGCGGHAA